MSGFDALATIVVLGPRANEIRAAMLEAHGRVRGAKAVIVASPLGDDGAIARVAGAMVEDATLASRALLAGIARLLGDDPFARKW
jgi:hypothetical protein